MMTVFAEPSKYDLYKAGKHAMANWSEVQTHAEKALAELVRGNCARCGFSFGKLFR